MSATYETDGPEFERDWHQEDKDNRAQGFDRDPEPPEDEPPLSLDVIEELLRVANKGGRFSRELREALGYGQDRPVGLGEAYDLLLGVALPQLLAQRRREQKELAEWRGLPYKDEFSVYRTCSCSENCEGSRSRRPNAEKALADAKRSGGNAETRRIYTGPWVELQEAPY